MTIPATELAYAAGLFDGEGSVMIYNRRPGGGRHLQLMVSLCQTDLRPLIWLHERFGGQIRQRNKPAPRNRVPFEWYACGAAGEAFLTAIRPFLILKADRADVGLIFRRTIQKKGGIRIPIPAAVDEERERLRLKLKVLNSRGAA